VLSLKFLVNLEQNGNLFTLSTPLMTMCLQAKHEAAAEEWCRAIQLAILKKKRTSAPATPMHPLIE
jgi:hypothetical protein